VSNSATCSHKKHTSTVPYFLLDSRKCSLGFLPMRPTATSLGAKQHTRGGAKLLQQHRKAMN